MGWGSIDAWEESSGRALITVLKISRSSQAIFGFWHCAPHLQAACEGRLWQANKNHGAEGLFFREKRFDLCIVANGTRSPWLRLMVAVAAATGKGGGDACEEIDGSAPPDSARRVLGRQEAHRRSLPECAARPRGPQPEVHPAARRADRQRPRSSNAAPWIGGRPTRVPKHRRDLGLKKKTFFPPRRNAYIHIDILILLISYNYIYIRFFHF